MLCKYICIVYVSVYVVCMMCVSICGVSVCGVNVFNRVPVWSFSPPTELASSYCSGLVASWQADMELSCLPREVSRVRASSGWGWLPILAEGPGARCLGLAARPNRDRMTE